jgi:hypothetical protein
VTDTLTAPPTATPQRARLFAPEGLEPRGRTLEDSVVATWRDLRLRGTASCLVCGSAVDAEGTCGHCGSELS